MYYTYGAPAAGRFKANYTVVQLVHGVAPGATIQTLRSPPKGIYVRPTASPNPAAITVYPYVTYGVDAAANVAYGTTSFGSPPTLAWNELSYVPYGVYLESVSGDVYVANGDAYVFYWPRGAGDPQTLIRPISGEYIFSGTNLTGYTYTLSSAYAAVLSGGGDMFVADGGDAVAATDLHEATPKGTPAIVRYTALENQRYSVPGDSPPGTFVERVADGFWRRPFGLLADNTNSDLWVADAGNVTSGSGCNGFVARLPNVRNLYPLFPPYNSANVAPVLMGRGWSSPRGLWRTSNGEWWVADAGCGTAVRSFLARVPAAMADNFTLTEDMKVVIAPPGATIAGVAAEPAC